MLLDLQFQKKLVFLPTTFVFSPCINSNPLIHVSIPVYQKNEEEEKAENTHLYFSTSQFESLISDIT